MEPGRNSLYRNMAPYLMGMIVLSVILVAVNSVYVIGQANRRLRGNDEASLHIVWSSLNQELSSMSRNSEALMESAQVRRLAYMGYDEEAYVDVITEMQKNLLICQYVCGMWFETENGEISVWSPDLKKEESQRWRILEAYFSDPAHGEGADQWEYVQIEGEGWLIRQREENKIRYGMWCNASYILSCLNGQYTESGTQVKLAEDALPKGVRIRAAGGSDIVKGMVLQLIGTAGRIRSMDMTIVVLCILGAGCIGFILLLWRQLQKNLIHGGLPCFPGLSRRHAKRVHHTAGSVRF